MEGPRRPWTNSTSLAGRNTFALTRFNDCVGRILGAAVARLEGGRHRRRDGQVEGKLGLEIQ
jgi:hypothetical protein